MKTTGSADCRSFSRILFLLALAAWSAACTFSPEVPVALGGDALAGDQTGADAAVDAQVAETLDGRDGVSDADAEPADGRDGQDGEAKDSAQPEDTQAVDSAADTPEAGPDTKDECGQAADCGAPLTPCYSFACEKDVENVLRCVRKAQNEGGACDADGSTCTPDSCMDGVCVPGTDLCKVCATNVVPGTFCSDQQLSTADDICVGPDMCRGWVSLTYPADATQKVFLNRLSCTDKSCGAVVYFHGGTSGSSVKVLNVALDGPSVLDATPSTFAWTGGIPLISGAVLYVRATENKFYTFEAGKWTLDVVLGAKLKNLGLNDTIDAMSYAKVPYKAGWELEQLFLVQRMVISGLNVAELPTWYCERCLGACTGDTPGWNCSGYGALKPATGTSNSILENLSLPRASLVTPPPDCDGCATRAAPLVLLESNDGKGTNQFVVFSREGGSWAELGPASVSGKVITFGSSGQGMALITARDGASSGVFLVRRTSTGIQPPARIPFSGLAPGTHVLGAFDGQFMDFFYTAIKSGAGMKLGFLACPGETLSGAKIVVSLCTPADLTFIDLGGMVDDVVVDQSLLGVASSNGAIRLVLSHATADSRVLFRILGL